MGSGKPTIPCNLYCITSHYTNIPFYNKPRKLWFIHINALPKNLVPKWSCYQLVSCILHRFSRAYIYFIWRGLLNCTFLKKKKKKILVHWAIFAYLSLHIYDYYYAAQEASLLSYRATSGTSLSQLGSSRNYFHCHWYLVYPAVSMQNACTILS